MLSAHLKCSCWHAVIPASFELFFQLIPSNCEGFFLKRCESAKSSRDLGWVVQGFGIFKLVRITRAPLHFQILHISKIFWKLVSCKNNPPRTTLQNSTKMTHKCSNYAKVLWDCVNAFPLKPAYSLDLNVCQLVTDAKFMEDIKQKMKDRSILWNRFLSLRWRLGIRNQWVCKWAAWVGRCWWNLGHGVYMYMYSRPAATCSWFKLGVHSCTRMHEEQGVLETPHGSSKNPKHMWSRPRCANLEIF